MSTHTLPIKLNPIHVCRHNWFMSGYSQIVRLHNSGTFVSEVSYTSLIFASNKGSLILSVSRIAAENIRQCFLWAPAEQWVAACLHKYIFFRNFSSFISPVFWILVNNLVYTGCYLWFLVNRVATI